MHCSEGCQRGGFPEAILLGSVNQQRFLEVFEYPLLISDGVICAPKIIECVSLLFAITGRNLYRQSVVERVQRFLSFSQRVVDPADLGEDIRLTCAVAEGFI